MTSITVIGLGAMGGGMARSLLRSDAVGSVAGFDLNPEVVSKFYEEAKAVGKAACAESPQQLTLDRFVGATTTDVVLIVLVNEAQCQSVCFGNSPNSSNIESLLRQGSTVIVSSTVTPAWSKRAFSRFAEKGIKFLDCPISGGPVRSLAGEISIFASGEPEDLHAIDPLFQAMGAEIHIVKGGAGMGSTVKMVHQLLAGVHIAVAAEALALAAKAGLDVKQMYDIVKGAAGNSWMFSDRGKRMIEYTGEDSEKVMSSVAIFVKDMDIVYSSAKTLKCPVPIATAALQQFIGGTGLGLDRKDDSQVVKVYEALSGVSVSASAAAAAAAPESGNNIGDIWVLADGTKETIVDCSDERNHHDVICNDYTRVMKAVIPSGDCTGAHRHSKKSVYFFLTECGIDFENHVKGSEPVSDRVEFGEVRYAPHSEDAPLVHKLTDIKGDKGKDLVCIDAEILQNPPVVAMDPLVEEHHVLTKSTENCRVYKLTLQPNESASVSYPFFSLSVVLKGSTVQTKISSAISWERVHATGDVAWNSPSIGNTITNTGNTIFEQYIAEWC